MKKFLPFAIVYLLLAAAISVSIGLFETPDSFIYAGLGEYLFNGTFLEIHPFHTSSPETLFGPVYSIFLFPLLTAGWPVGVVLVPLFQLLLLGISAYLVSIITTPTAGLLVPLLPFAIIYTTFMMSEIMTMTWVSLFIYTLFLQLHKKKNVAGWLVLIGALATLTRYAYISLFLVGIIVFFRHPSKKIIHAFPAILGLGLIIWWLIFHYQLFGFVGLSTVTGRHLYNNVVTLGKLTPPESDPAAVRFLQKFPVREDLFGPWWNTQFAFMDDFRNRLFTEHDIDRLFGAYAVAAIRAHPFAYGINILRSALITPLTPPVLGTMLTDTSEICRMKWNSHLCAPPIHSAFLQSVWRLFVKFSLNLYPYVSAILFLLATAGIVNIFLKGDVFLKSIAGLFLFQHLFQSSTEWIEGRFLIPLYPIYAILIVYGIASIKELWNRRTLRNFFHIK